jgi:AraC-like DNA-binding protein
MVTNTIITDNNYFSLSKTLYKKGHSYAPHCHKNAAISVVLNGIIHEEIDSELRIGKSAVTIIKPSEIVHQNIYTEDCLILCLYLKDIAKKKLKSNFILEEWTWLNGLNCLPYFGKILKSQTEKQIEENTSELLQYISTFKKKPDIQKIPDWLAEVKTFIDNDYSLPINVTDIAKRHKIHRVYLARIFQQHYGQSIKSYLKALRIHHAAAGLLKGHSIKDTTFENGFSDQSHLHRNFKEQTMQTPIEFKKIFHS